MLIVEGMSQALALQADRVFIVSTTARERFVRKVCNEMTMCQGVYHIGTIEFEPFVYLEKDFRTCNL
jgi:hypothetical protein